MTDPAFWISYGLPAFGVAFGLVGITVAWLSARRFDARFSALEAPSPAGRKPRLSPYRRSPSRPRHGKPGQALPKKT